MHPDPVPGPLFSRRGFLYLLCVLILLRLLLNCMVPLMDPSEARYALICKIMAESGNYLEPKLIHDGILMNFEGKPPLSFQAGAIACRIFGVNLFAVRLPSFLFAAGLLGVPDQRRKRRTACRAAFTVQPGFLPVCGDVHDRHGAGVLRVLRGLRIHVVRP